MSNLEVVFATTNPAKATEVKTLGDAFDVTVLTPSEVGIKPIEVEETGTTYQENAALKVEPYREQAAQLGLVICGDDTGIEIDALKGEPGIHTRRWLGYEMSDDEIVGYTLGRMYGKWVRSATFRTAVAYSVAGAPIEFTEGALEGHIVKHPYTRHVHDEGAPLRRLFMVTGEPPAPLTEFHRRPLADRNGRLTHREMAFAAFFDILRERN